MEAIIIISVIVVFFINLYFIDSIYKIVDGPVAVSTNTSNENFIGSLKDALIMGDNETCQKISNLLYKHNITTDILNDIDDIDKSYPYKYVLAVFDDDLENLTICTIAINIMGINNALAICNKIYNQKIYDENHIITFNNNASAFEIVSLLLNFSKRET